MDIPAGITEIARHVFNCCGLTAIDIPDTVVKIGPAVALPWYDDRVEAVRKDAAPVAEAVEEPAQYTPREIYDYLDRHVWKQTEAKKAASVIMYNALHGIRSTAMFISPSGCGKTHTWRCLKEIFPGRIEIVDSSSVSLDGWKGSTKWKDLLRSPSSAP